MKFGIGDTCYIIENDEVKRARVSAKKDGQYFVQFVGSCGALAVPEDKIYRTPEEAEAGKQKRRKPESRRRPTDIRRSSICNIII